MERARARWYGFDLRRMDSTSGSTRVGDRGYGSVDGAAGTVVVIASGRLWALGEVSAVGSKLARSTSFSDTVSVSSSSEL